MTTLVWIPPIVFCGLMVLFWKTHLYGSWFMVINAWVLALFAYDKRQAIKGGRRIPERNLFVAIASGGFLGAIFSMFGFRHKIRKGSFYMVVILSLALHGWIGFKVVMSKF